ASVLLVKSLPTASQKTADVHDTPARLPAGAGIVCARQDKPCHTSAVPAPTASQKVIETQDTDCTSLVPGIACRRHDLPFHRSANGAPEPLPPPAWQNFAETHDTAFSMNVAGPAPSWGLGVGCLRQEVPFQVAARVKVLRKPSL